MNLTAGKKYIGILEDITTDRFLYINSISRLSPDFECILFENPTHAREMVRQFDFHIIFFNIHFWGTDFGLQVFNEIRSINPMKTEYIAVTSFLQPGDIVKLQLHGIRKYFEKPAIFRELHLTLDGLITENSPLKPLVS
jgi:DNA-binding response OmpR family regulator